MTIAYTLPTLDEIRAIVQSPASTISYLLEHGIIDSERTCNCGGTMKSNPERQRFRCTRKACRKEITIFTGTFFAGAKIPCTKVLEIAYFWLSKASATQIVTYTGVSGVTVQAYVHHLQQLTADSLEEEDFVIGGEGVVVEVDETKLGKRKYNRGHRVDGVWVFCAVERTPERKLFCKKLENRSSFTLTSTILSHVRCGSVIMTDCWRGYSDLSASDYTHLTVNHSIEFRDSQTGACTNTVEETIMRSRC